MDDIRLTPADVVEKPEPDEHAEPGPPEVEAGPVIRTGVFRAVVDAAGGQLTYVELTEDEVADAAMERSAIASVRATRATAVDAARATDLSIVQEAAAKDPAYAALARLVGIDPVGNVVVEVDPVT
jgi:hypothetical protein